MAKQKQLPQPFIRFLFVVYCLVMLWLLFGRSSGFIDGLTYKEQLPMNINLKPLFTIGNYWRVVVRNTNPALVRHCVINLGGNIFLFIPAGYLLPRIFPRQRNFFLFFFTCTAAILLVELVQLVTLLGCFDIDDLILNLAGMTLGFIAHLFIHRTK